MENWNDYFMGIARQVATRSKDPSSKVGAIIVSPDNKIIATGFNGWVAGIDESMMTYDRPLKYYTICHAELNALIFAVLPVKGCKIYTTHGPCENCLKYLLQAGITEIYYEDPSPMTVRGSYEQKEAIRRLLLGSYHNIKCMNITNNKTYFEELDDRKNN